MNASRRKQDVCAQVSRRVLPGESMRDYVDRFKRVGLGRRPLFPVLGKRFDESTAALRAATFIQLVLGDAYLELSAGYSVPDVAARFALQIDEAVSAALR
jgi:hypothetical protein